MDIQEKYVIIGGLLGIVSTLIGVLIGMQYTQKILDNEAKKLRNGRKDNSRTN